MKLALTAAEQLSALGAYDQAASFYDAAVSIADKCSDCADPWRKAKIILEKAAMFKKYGQRERWQIALGELKKALIPALECTQLIVQPPPVRREFAVTALMALSQWEPRHPADAADFQMLHASLRNCALLDEADLCEAVMLLSQKSIGNPNLHMHSTVSVAVHSIDKGPDAPYSSEILKFAGPALHTTHANQVAKRLLPMCVPLLGRKPSADQLVDLRRAVVAITPEENSDDLGVLSLFHSILAESAAADTLEEQMQFYRHAITTQAMLVNWDIPDYEVWSNCAADLANLLLRQNHPDQALAIYEQANSTVLGRYEQNLEPEAREFIARNKLAMAEIMMQQGNWKAAEQLCRQVRDPKMNWSRFRQCYYADALLVRCVAHNRGLAAATSALGKCDAYFAYPVVGRLDLVKRDVLKARMSTDDPGEQSDDSNSLGIYAMLEGDPQRCVGYMKSALDRTQSETGPGKNTRLAIRYWNYGRALSACDRDGEAEAAFRTALKYAPTVGPDLYFSMMINYELGNLLFHRGELSQAEKCFGDAEDISEHTEGAYSALYRVIRAYKTLANKDVAGARREVHYALRHAHENHSWDECQALRCQTEVCLAEGNRQAAKQSAARAMRKMKAYTFITPSLVLSSDYLNGQRLCKKLGVSD